MPPICGLLNTFKDHSLKSLYGGELAPKKFSKAHPPTKRNLPNTFIMFRR